MGFLPGLLVHASACKAATPCRTGTTKCARGTPTTAASGRQGTSLATSSVTLFVDRSTWMASEMRIKLALLLAAALAPGTIGSLAGYVLGPPLADLPMAG